MRNLQMAERIAATPAHHPFTFVVAGDTGAWADPTADAIYGQLLRQAAALDPAFLANLGDFAGPGTAERHARYLQLVAGLPMTDVCVIGNHDLDDPSGPDAWAAVHGPTNFQFAYGSTRFVGIDAAPAEVRAGTAGPRDEALTYLDEALAVAPEPHKVVLMHAPPAFGGRFDPHPEWGFNVGEHGFLDLVKRHDVALVCCAHALLFDHHVHHGTHFVVSGGGGTGLCSHFRGICAEGDGRPEERGALFHAVAITVDEDGPVAGRVLQAFGGVRFSFDLRRPPGLKA